MIRSFIRAQAADPLPPLASTLIALGVASPWLLGFSASHAAIANHIAFAMAFAPISLMMTSLRPASATCMVGGAWLAISPWPLAYASQGPAAWGVDLLIGGALMWMAWRAWRQPLGTTKLDRPAARELVGPALRPEPSATSDSERAA